MGTIAESFNTIAQRTQLSASDDEAFARHEGEVTTRMRNDFSVVKSLRMGSMSRGSAVRGTSDLDLLIVLKREEVVVGTTNTLKSSDTVMASVRSSLCARFPNSDIGRDGQAVVVSFSDGRDVDVVPAAYAGAQDSGWPLYWIPDGSGGWLKTAPDTHGKYIADGDGASGYKMKTVVRLLKYWAQQRAPWLPLSGFHLELLLAVERACLPGMSLAACVAEALSLLAQRECRALQDPCGISGYIAAAASDAKRDRLLASARQCAGWARTAVSSEATNDPRGARYYWNLVYNNGFPA